MHFSFHFPFIDIYIHKKLLWLGKSNIYFTFYCVVWLYEVPLWFVPSFFFSLLNGTKHKAWIWLSLFFCAPLLHAKKQSSSLFKRYTKFIVILVNINMCLFFWKGHKEHFVNLSRQLDELPWRKVLVTRSSMLESTQ